MLDDVLFGDIMISRLDTELAAKAERSDGSVDVSHPIYGGAFRRYMLFTESPSLADGKFVLSPEQRLYNRYYWFTKFSALWQSVHGRDVGLDQQAFKMLEGSSANLDWGIIEEIQARVNAECASGPG